ncbi:hypothetical protein DM860_014945 [Cuscuta australis]|uniref:Uncharacterized protein n=1 Tax=Cuscuta australis TaxID=267555 RepID=A0A328E645_9ASTE|nr:hypothetical protein DM860_014945 [Cuscuta australis]
MHYFSLDFSFVYICFNFLCLIIWILQFFIILFLREVSSNSLLFLWSVYYIIRSTCYSALCTNCSAICSCKFYIALIFRCFATTCVQWWEQGEKEAESSQQRTRTRRQRLNRDRAAAHASLFNDYFNTPCVYTPEDFSNHFRMSHSLFLRILADVEREVPWFTQRFDARGRRRFSSVQKCTAMLRQMAYEMTSDMFDEYLKMSARSIRSCVYKFSKTIIQIYHKRYLRKPTASNIQQLQARHAAKHDFVDMLGSIDCTH